MGAVSQEKKAMQIVVGNDVFCPCCGASEVENTSLPVDQWKWQIRPNRVESAGVWWSECLICKIWFGGDYVEVSEKTTEQARDILGIEPDRNGRYRYE